MTVYVTDINSRIKYSVTVNMTTKNLPLDEFQEMWTEETRKSQKEWRKNSILSLVTPPKIYDFFLLYPTTPILQLTQIKLTKQKTFYSAPQIFAFFVNLLFLGQAFTIMLVYVWSRRNPFIRMNFFGLLNFLAPYLPWVLLGFSVILGNTIWVDLMGMAVGHIYYFLEDVFPKQRGGMRILKTPLFLYVHRQYNILGWCL